MTENGRPAGPAKCQVSSIEPHKTQSWRAAERSVDRCPSVPASASSSFPQHPSPSHPTKLWRKQEPGGGPSSRAPPRAHRGKKGDAAALAARGGPRSWQGLARGGGSSPGSSGTEWDSSALECAVRNLEISRRQAKLGATAGGLAAARYFKGLVPPLGQKKMCGRTWERRSRDRDGPRDGRGCGAFCSRLAPVFPLDRSHVAGWLCVGCLCIAVCSARGEATCMSVVVERELVDQIIPSLSALSSPLSASHHPPEPPSSAAQRCFASWLDRSEPAVPCRPRAGRMCSAPVVQGGGQRQPLLILSSARTTTTVQLMNRSDGHRSAVESHRPFGVPTGFSAL